MPRVATDSVFQAIACPTRRALIDELTGGERNVTGLVESLDVSQSAVSQQLAILKTAGLVEERAEGRFRYYRLRAKTYLFPMCNVGPSVQVTAAWGWSAIPDEVKQAALIKAGALFRRKDSLEGILGGFQEFGAIRVGSREDRDVVALLKYYRTTNAQLLV